MTVTTSVPVLRVGDFPRARAFWRDMLVFEVTEEAGEPASFGIFRLDAARVFPNAQNGPDAPGDHWRACFHTDDLESLATRLDAAELPYQGPNDTIYRMRELQIADPDGNVVCFGQDLP